MPTTLVPVGERVTITRAFHANAYIGQTGVVLLNDAATTLYETSLGYVVHPYLVRLDGGPELYALEVTPVRMRRGGLIDNPEPGQQYVLDYAWGFPQYAGQTVTVRRITHGFSYEDTVNGGYVLHRFLVEAADDNMFYAARLRVPMMGTAWIRPRLVIDNGPWRWLGDNDDRVSEYEDRDGVSVFLGIGTAQRLVSIDDLDLDDLWDRRESKFLYDSTAWWTSIREMLIDPSEADDWLTCGHCSRPTHTDDSYYVEGEGSVCEPCRDHYTPCDGCECLYSNIIWLGEYAYCLGCLQSSDSFAFCNHCDQWHDIEGDDGSHNHGGRHCRCESPAQTFSVRNDGQGMLGNDTTITIGLPKGHITDEGLDSIGALLRNSAYRAWMTTEKTEADAEVYNKWCSLSNSLEDLGHEWQGKRGTYAKRLSSLAHKKYGLKIPADMLSEVGNIARAHSDGRDLQVAFTRDLNLSPEEFAHEDSCWWGSYAESRCALKSNGGFAMRSFTEYGTVTGRAWVMPVRAVDDYLEPTFNTEDPDGFIVFNGYGELSDYTPARVMSYMAGMTYRKVDFNVESMYVNGNQGYLVAPEELATQFTDGTVELDCAVHARLFETEQANITEKELAHV